MDFTYRPVNINEYFDKILYINMDKDVARNRSMLDQFEKFGITNFQRIAGSDLMALPQPISYRNFIKNDEKYIKGQLGCRRAHLNAIHFAKVNGYQRVLILEDDVEFLVDPSDLLTINQEILNDWDMLYFGGLVEPFFRNQIVCAHAYGVTANLYDDILEMGDHSGMEIDNFYAKVIQHMSYNHTSIGKYRIRVIQPFNKIIQNKSHASNIV
jgi:GR25 family glycosyltransferase involved in LPS biosynthesis